MTIELLLEIEKENLVKEEQLKELCNCSGTDFTSTDNFLLVKPIERNEGEYVFPWFWTNCFNGFPVINPLFNVNNQQVVVNPTTGKMIKKDIVHSPVVTINARIAGDYEELLVEAHKVFLGTDSFNVVTKKLLLFHGRKINLKDLPSRRVGIYRKAIKRALSQAR